MTDAPFEIHRCGPEDAGLVQRAGALFDHAPLTAETERFLTSSGHHLLLALVGSEPVGFVSGIEVVHPDKVVEMLLYELAVAEDAQGRGIGTALATALAHLARDRGCRGMWVLTDEDNTAARMAYTRAGATIEERTLLLEWRF